MWLSKGFRQPVILADQCRQQCAALRQYLGLTMRFLNQPREVGQKLAQWRGM
ncbi:hypothetical protein D3C80_2242360 [compost metagenome]